MKLFTGSGEAGCATAGNSGSGALGGGRITGGVVDEVSGGGGCGGISSPAPEVCWSSEQVTGRVGLSAAGL